MSERARATEPAPPADTDGFSGLMSALRGMAERLAEAGKAAGAAEHGHSINFGSGDSRVVFGYSVRMGQDGASAEPFGDIPRPGKFQAAEPEPRQPITDVFAEEDAVVVVAELPGADAGSIDCRVEGRVLLIEAQGARRYRKEIALPDAVRAADMQTSFRNGILEVRLPRELAP
jgi:HSP20 family protein